MSHILSARHYREAIAATCFESPELSGFAEQVRTFTAPLVDWRWASLAKFVQQLVPLQGALMKHWYPTSVLHSSWAASRIADEGSVTLREFDASVKNTFMWCYAAMLLQLIETIDDMMSWAEMCPCHQCLSFEVGDESAWRCSDCPLKGSRGPEMACGEWRLFLQSSLACVSPQLLPKLGALWAEERGMVISDVQEGGRHLGALAKLKFSFREELPYALVGVGHWREDAAREAAARCLAQWEVIAARQAA